MPLMNLGKCLLTPAPFSLKLFVHFSSITIPEIRIIRFHNDITAKPLSRLNI